MGVGDSLEAAFTLAGPIRAGRWHLVGDGLVLSAADVQFDVLHRRAAGGDTPIAQFVHHFDPISGPTQFDAMPFEADGDAPAVDGLRGDQLILRFSAADSDGGGAGAAYIPNGDGAKAHGRIPSLTLPH